MIRTIKRYDSHEALREDQLRHWQSMSPAARMDAAWQLVVDYRRHHDLQPHEPRLEKRITSVRKTGLSSGGVRRVIE